MILINPTGKLEISGGFRVETPLSGWRISVGYLGQVWGCYMHHSVFIIDLLPDPLIGGYSSDIRHPDNGFGVQALPAKTKGLGFK